VNPAPLRRAESLRRLLAPKSLAVVGVSAEPTSFGARTITNMRGFAGPVYAVNPKYAGQELHGYPCVASITDLPEAVDSVVLCMPRTGILANVELAAARGVGGLTIYASGYGETDLPERAVEEEHLRARAREARPRARVHARGGVLPGAAAQVGRAARARAGEPQPRGGRAIAGGQRQEAAAGVCVRARAACRQPPLTGYAERPLRRAGGRRGAARVRRGG
jgi:predicted CoA-binding protein